MWHFVPTPEYPRPQTTQLEDPRELLTQHPTIQPPMTQPQSNKRAREEDDDDRRDDQGRDKRTKTFRAYELQAYCSVAWDQPRKDFLHTPFRFHISSPETNTTSALLRCAHGAVMDAYVRMAPSRTPGGPGPLPMRGAKVTLFSAFPDGGGGSESVLRKKRRLHPACDLVELAVVDHGVTDLAALIEAERAEAGCENPVQIWVQVAYPGASWKVESRAGSDVDMADVDEKVEGEDVTMDD